jgi:hypothetical protein
MWHQVTAGAWVGHRSRDSGDDARRREGFRRNGGNFVLAAPDPAYTYPAVQKCGLTIQVSTKLNRSHLIHGRDALILPCLGRTEKDHGNEGLQGITVEDSMRRPHNSRCARASASRKWAYLKTGNITYAKEFPISLMLIAPTSALEN